VNELALVNSLLFGAAEILSLQLRFNQQ